MKSPTPRPTLRHRLRGGASVTPPTDVARANLTTELPDQLVEPLVVKPKTARHLLSVGTTRLYEILPDLVSYRDGRSRLITMDSIRAYVARRIAESQEVA